MPAPSRLNLSEFDISETWGFLREDPLDRLSEQFDAWHDAANSMADLYAKGLFHEMVRQMPLLDWTLLKDKREKLLAHLQLSLITSAYVWQNGPDNPAKILPACVAVPLWNISKDMDIQPMISHPGFVLANWKLKDPSKPFALNNLSCLYPLPGGVDGESIITITQVIEVQFAQALKCIVEGAYSVDITGFESLTSAILKIRDVLQDMTHTFTNIHNLMRPDVFFKNLVPMIQGWGKEGTPLANGLLYEGVSDKPIKCVSFSAAQTSIAQCLDAFLDIPHKPEATESLLNFRTYMLQGHRRFIEVLEARPSTKKFVLRSGNEDLKKAYNECLGALSDFRSYHVKAVAKYIVVMSNKMKDANAKKPIERKETDEAKLMSFLKGLRTETKENVLSEKEND